MRHLVFASCLGLCVAIGGRPHLCADPPAPPVAIAGATKYPPFALVRLRADGAGPKAALLWRVSPADGVERATTPRGVLEFVAPPGRYRVELLVVTAGADGVPVVEERFAAVEIEAPGRPDPPKPEPKRPDPAAALGRIQFGSAGCTATVVGPRRADGRWDVLTAAHCVSRVGQRGVMQLKDGRKLNVTVAALHPDPDCAWLVSDESFPDLAAAEIAKEPPPVGTAVWHQGYGVDKPGNREDGVVAAGPDSNGQIRMTLSVSSGDSGGGIFRADSGELVSVVCCTTNRGGRGSVWGSSPTVARAKRPGAAADEFVWTPLDIPTRGDEAAERRCRPAPHIDPAN